MTRATHELTALNRGAESGLESGATSRVPSPLEGEGQDGGLLESQPSPSRGRPPILSFPLKGGRDPRRSIEILDAVRTPADDVAIASAPAAILRHLPLRDAALATTALIGAIAVGSGFGARLDPALFGYLGATLVAAFACTWRASAFWRRPASAFYARALLGALRRPGSLRATAVAAGRDLAAQDFIRQRSTARWLAHMLLAFGTLASFAITLPLVFGWLHFAADGDYHYRVVLAGVPTLRFAVDGVIGWLLFHGLSLAAVAVVAGAAYFVGVRLRARRLPGATAGFAMAPLALLILVALTGLALPASRGWPGLFPIAAFVHQVTVVVLLVALPFSKLAHVLIRPLQLGARAVRGAGAVWQPCASCGAPLAPVAQQQAVGALLAQRGMRLAQHLSHCPPCRRKQVAAAQAGLLGAHFHPPIVGARPARRASDQRDG